jgi:hypothetical protein
VLEPDEDELDELGDDDAYPAAHAEPAPIERFHQTAVGSMLAAGLLGLRDVLEPTKQEEPAVVVDYSGDPPFTDPIVLRLDPDHPEDSIVMVRPWLRGSVVIGDELAGDGAPVEDAGRELDPEPGSGRDA